jgi:hypothetical protein
VVDRSKRTAHPTGLDILLCLSQSRVDDGPLCRRQHLVRIHDLLGRDDDLALGARDLDKVTFLEPEFVADIFRDDDLAALAQLANGHGLPPWRCVGLRVHLVRLSDARDLSRHLARLTG